MRQLLPVRRGSRGAKRQLLPLRKAARTRSLVAAIERERGDEGGWLACGYRLLVVALIARAHRVFRDELKKALATYTERGGTVKTALDQDEAVAVMLEEYEVCYGLFHGFDWRKWTSGTPAERLTLLPSAHEHILAQL